MIEESLVIGGFFVTQIAIFWQLNKIVGQYNRIEQAVKDLPCKKNSGQYCLEKNRRKK